MENAKTQGARFPRFGPYCSIDYTAWTGGALFDAYNSVNSNTKLKSKTLQGVGRLHFYKISIPLFGCPTLFP